MTYTCELCNYKTDNKSNLNRHLKSKLHEEKSGEMDDSDLVVSKTPQNSSDHTNNLICPFCKMTFSRSSNLTRHKQKCTDKNMEIREKDKEIQLLKHHIEQLNQMIQNNKPISNNSHSNNTYNISVKNYIQQNYPDAPPLQKLNDYSLLDDDISHLTDNLVYNFNHKQLDKYVGEFLVKYYKKEDSTQQSIWNSDVSRITYLIKELLGNKKSIWNHDYKGVKTKEYIITPLLKYIKDYIHEYLNTDFKADLYTYSQQECEKFVQKQLTLGFILQYIDTNLADDVVKYIAPKFKLKKLNNENFANNDQSRDDLIECSVSKSQ